MSEPLIIVSGADRTVLLDVFDENDNAADLTDATSASFAMKGDALDASPVLEYTGLAVDVSNSQITLVFASADTLIIPPGIYVCDVKLITSSGNYYSMRFYTKVITAISS